MKEEMSWLMKVTTALVCVLIVAIEPWPSDDENADDN